MAQEGNDGQQKGEFGDGLNVRVALLQQEVHTIRAQIAQLVTRMEFWPVKMLTYGIAMSILTGVVAAVLSVVLRH